MMLYGTSRSSFELFLDGTENMQIQTVATRPFALFRIHDSSLIMPID